MGRLHSGTARVVRGVRPIAKPFVAVKDKASSFADKVSMDVIEQDVKASSRKVIFDTAKNISKIMKENQAQKEQPKAEVKHVKPTGEVYSIQFYKGGFLSGREGVAGTKSMHLAEGFEHLLRLMANKPRPQIEMGPNGGNYVNVLHEGKKEKFLLGGGEFSEMLTNIQLHLAGYAVQWTCDMPLMFEDECWKSLEDYNLWASHINEQIERGKSKFPNKGHNIIYTAVFEKHDNPLSATVADIENRMKAMFN